MMIQRHLNVDARSFDVVLTSYVRWIVAFPLNTNKPLTCVSMFVSCDYSPSLCLHFPFLRVSGPHSYKDNRFIDSDYHFYTIFAHFTIQ